MSHWKSVRRKRFWASPHDDHGRSVSHRYIENVDGRIDILRAKVFLAMPYLEMIRSSME